MIESNIRSLGIDEEIAIPCTHGAVALDDLGFFERGPEGEGEFDGAAVAAPFVGHYQGFARGVVVREVEQEENTRRY
jgi:hypothetical protein